MVSIQIINLQLLIDRRLHPIKKLTYSSTYSVLRTPRAITQLEKLYFVHNNVIVWVDFFFFWNRQTSVLLQPHLFWKYCTLFNIVVVQVVCVCVCVVRQVFCSIQDDTCIESMVNVLVYQFGHLILWNIDDKYI